MPAAEPGRAILPVTMDPASITAYLTSELEGTVPVEMWGTTFFYYRPAADPPEAHDVYFATLTTADDAFDASSKLDREGVYRLNVGVSKQTFAKLFGSNRVEVEEIDCAALDAVMPHPLYHGASWLCVLNPSRETFEELKPLLAEAHERAARELSAREARSGESQTAEATPPEG